MSRGHYVIPKLVEDVSLKRARVELESGETAIRTTSGSSTDVTAISNALGQQTDPASEASVIGLLKNLIANSGGGGGGESSTYPVFKSLLAYADISTTQTTNLSQHLYTDYTMTQSVQIPEWAKVAIFCPKISHQEPMYPIKILKKSSPQSDYELFSSSASDFNGTLEYVFAMFSFGIAFNSDIVFYPSSNYYYTITIQPPNTINFVKELGMFSSVLYFDVFFFDTDPLEISGGGGGSGGTVETYNLTINNVSATNITAPISSPPSADDQTLASKAYVDSQVTSKSLSYQPVSEQQLNIYTSYSIATLLGQTTWDFPFSGGGSMDFVFSYGSAPGRNIWYRCHVPLPSYLNTQVTPKIYVALAQISNYPVTDDSNGELQGILLEYDTVAKTIQFIGGEGVIVENGPDNFKEAYAQGDLHPWFWGLTCNSFI